MLGEDFSIFSWVILPLLIFAARVADVSLGTVRLVLVARGYKYLAPLVGFAEVLIWILVIGQIMQNLSNWVCYVAYAGGFATGNFVGMWMAEKMLLGTVMVRVVTQRDAGALLAALRQVNCGVTTVDGTGAQGPVKILFTVVRQRQLPLVLALVQEHNPQSFYTVEDVEKASYGVFPNSRAPNLPTLFPSLRKGK